MADDHQMDGTEEIELSHPNSNHHQRSSSAAASAFSSEENDEGFDGRFASEWAVIERLPTFQRIRASLFGDIIAANGNGNGNGGIKKGCDNYDGNKRVVDVSKLGASEKHLFIEKLIRHIQNDNLKLLQKIRKRIDKVGVKLPAVEVRYHDLRIEAECEVVDGKPLPTLWNSFKSNLLDLTRLVGLKPQTSKISIIDGVNGVIKPGRLTLLLGPPGCGKTSFLKALSGNLGNPLKVNGEIYYNGYKLSEFVPQKTCAYISQYDLHIPEMTVRETLDFSACCQGIGRREEIMVELSHKEREARVVPDPDVDTYMKAISVEGKRTTLQTDYILKILGLDICADTIVGDALRRGISGGEKKRLTTGEMIVGPTHTLFMDEISNGLDSSTTHQIIACLQHLAHIAGATILVSLLQPAPETFDLFDDIILMAKGKLIYHGPRSSVLEFFESCGFRCPERKGVADFLQEVISEKDQAQYWNGGEGTYSYISVDTFSRKFEESDLGKALNAHISVPFEKSEDSKRAISFSSYSLPKWTLFKACISRELLLMKRNSFVYLHKTIQLFIIASMTMTVFLRRRTDLNLIQANHYMGALFFALINLVIDGLPELSMTVGRLPVFYKQRDLFFYPAWAYTIPSAVLKIPLSMLESAVWTSITYYGIGYSPDLGRFFRHMILLFALHFSSISMFRFLASVCRTVVATTFAGSLSLLLLSLFSGFLIPRSSMPIWLKWGFWVSPMTYGEIGLALNEFLAGRWQKMLPSNTTTVGLETLNARGLNFDKDYFWISVGALFGFTLIFNVGFTLALSFLNPVGSRAIISREKLSETQRSKRSSNIISHADEMPVSSSADKTGDCHKGKVILPFEPLTVVFKDLQYYVGAPPGMKENGFNKKRLQLLRDITGALKPGVLTALMGVSGAGKTTLLDVLAGRKTSGIIEGEIKIEGYPKVQKTFARVSGYCEQNDIHSPNITIEESLIFSAWLRLDPQIDAKTKSDFVKQVLETIELDSAKDHLVGIPGDSGLSTEQRKRLTIAVELVANPSIMFLDEPTTGLDARAAAIVMRAVKNVADTGRTIVCTIHQPSIGIFEKFDELILLKPGGRMMYYGPLGENSCKVIEYFESTVLDEERAELWATIERLPTMERLRCSLFDEMTEKNEGGDNTQRKKVVDVTKLGPVEKHLFIEKLIKHVEHDNLAMLYKIKKRMDKVGVAWPTVEIRYKNLHVEAECEVVSGKPLPTLWNYLRSMILDLPRIAGISSQLSKICILADVSGIVKPGRMTLILGPPGCGKTSLLKALSGNLDKSLQVSGEISYNRFKLNEFVPQKTSAYISQYDMHVPEMTVRETLDFSSRCQGVGSRAAIMNEVIRKEKEGGLIPDPDIDTYMKGISVEGQKSTLQTEYILKILGLDICDNTIVGDAMRRGISGGEKKRLTTGEMIVGPTRALLMDEISNGLDSSTTFQIVSCLQQFAHLTDATVLVSLLQPAPETFDLFDDIILMSEGKIVYHGPRESILTFFENCGFKCPERKGVADFLQEAISKKDQEQYWCRSQESYTYHSVDALSMKFKESVCGKSLEEELSESFLTSERQKEAITFSTFMIPKWELFKACLWRELILMKRNSFVYVFKSLQLFVIASVTMTVFLRTRMDVDLLHSNYYLGALFLALTMILFNGTPELPMTVVRLGIFYKQRDVYLYPAWAYAIPSAILKIPISLLESVVWTSLTYYVIGYSPEIERFFRQLILLFLVHFTSISMFRFIASVCRTVILSASVASFSICFLLLFGGFLIDRPSMPTWLKWGFWVCPLAYGEIGLALNEFLAPRWQKMLPSNTSIGRQTLESRGLNFDGHFFWISVGALFGFILLFNIGFILALSFLNAPRSRVIISREKLSQLKGDTNPVRLNSQDRVNYDLPSTGHIGSCNGKMTLPFEPFSVVFQDLQYYINAPMATKEQGLSKKKIQILSDITGAFRPGVLAAVMGVSGAGKTTLLDVLAGRKTSGITEGNIWIGGFPKVQKTFARVLGYCEQTDIHSPQITVEESIIFSSWLRLHPQIDSRTRAEFVKEVLETIELDGIKDSLVGIQGISGLSTEQRKRLTIAVELVANPSILFMDEPTTGLDAKAAAIVMRAVKNISDTGRTVVCSIHQPSIDIFEAFDEVILLKTGGRVLYSGPLGQQSSKVIEYFEGISGVPKIKNNYNPATWMLEITSTSFEAELGLDFAEIYQKSALYKQTKELVRVLSTPLLDSKVLEFPSRFPLNGWGQFKACLWKQYWSYWRSPSYNIIRTLYMFITSLIFGSLFWGQGKRLDSQQNLFNVLGAMFSSTIFCGINNSTLSQRYVSRERNVLYREKFAGMYSPWAYAIAQVTIEIPYIFIQTAIYTVITYPMIGFSPAGNKVLWYFYTMFCTLLYFSYLGMLMVSITPSLPMASIQLSTCHTLFNIFAGFLVPQPQIPKWWVWTYYVTPTAWTLKGLLTSQYGDNHKLIQVFGENKSVGDFLSEYFGFNYSQLPLVGVVLFLYPVVFAFLFAYCIAKLHFQKR
ncbi:OLC1v1038679C1 [Oldenlandia corymbosa var. corymbosa]|uniref:OLC1v1038679C1 n=1 Tax=Oldenlandia corymbosa var. corymbosa TaxID=529605 RepID=A0AAV1D1L0_OLDCO|nr:OLC1v1038679C1 [Oldenlandia corymbosa var. corymbosa]